MKEFLFNKCLKLSHDCLFCTFRISCQHIKHIVHCPGFVRVYDSEERAVFHIEAYILQRLDFPLTQTGIPYRHFYHRLKHYLSVHSYFQISVISDRYFYRIHQILLLVLGLDAFRGELAFV